MNEGAFTGATDSKPGRFEAADGGTLVLDEIASLIPSSQAKLLRVIEERNFERLGGKQPINIDVRIIALANIDIKEAVRARTFRDDLYYRLAVVTIELPKLIDRFEDLPQLAAEFVRQFASRRGRAGVHLSSEAVNALSSYDFPGNVRELRNIIEHAVLTANDDVIDVAGLPEYLRSAARLMQSRKTKPSLAELEAVYIREVLEHTRGNKTRAAEILGISRKNLYEKIRRYNIGKLSAGSVALSDDMKLRFVWIGKTKRAPVKELIQEYLDRVGKFASVEVTELRDRDDVGGDARRIIEKEGEDILSRTASASYLIALDERGRELDSIKLAEMIEKHRLAGTKQITFVIGGHCGLSDAVRDRADYVLALSKMTLTHDLARVLLIEQVYRAFSIIHDLPYQK